MARNTLKPNVIAWDLWGHLDNAPLWKVIAISLNIAPEHVALEDGTVEWGTLPDEFNTRLQIARSHLGQKLRLHRKASGPYDLFPAGQEWDLVRLHDFAVWAEGERLSLPEQFPRPPGTKQSEELSTKERTSLLVIVGVLAKKAQIDIASPTTAAQQIVNLAAAEGVKIAERTVREYLKQIDEALDRKG